MTDINIGKESIQITILLGQKQTFALGGPGQHVSLSVLASTYILAKINHIAQLFQGMNSSIEMQVLTKVSRIWGS